MAIRVEGLAPLLQVFDMPTAIAFYRDLLGFDLVSTSKLGEHFGWALLTLNGTELMLNTAYEDDERPSAPDSYRVCAHADTTLFFSCPDLDGAYDHLRAKGLDVNKPVVRSYGMRQLSLKDPDGYFLCFQWRATSK